MFCVCLLFLFVVAYGVFLCVERVVFNVVCVRLFLFVVVVVVCSFFRVCGALCFCFVVCFVSFVSFCVCFMFGLVCFVFVGACDFCV